MMNMMRINSLLECNIIRFINDRVLFILVQGKTHANSDDIKQKLDNTVGVLETSQFLKMCDYIVVGTCNGARVYDAISIKQEKF